MVHHIKVTGPVFITLRAVEDGRRSFAMVHLLGVLTGFGVPNWHTLYPSGVAVDSGAHLVILVLLV